MQIRFININLHFDSLIPIRNSCFNFYWPNSFRRVPSAFLAISLHNYNNKQKAPKPAFGHISLTKSLSKTRAVTAQTPFGQWK